MAPDTWRPGVLRSLDSVRRHAVGADRGHRPAAACRSRGHPAGANAKPCILSNSLYKLAQREEDASQHRGGAPRRRWIYRSASADAVRAGDRLPPRRWRSTIMHRDRESFRAKPRCCGRHAGVRVPGRSRPHRQSVHLGPTDEAQQYRGARAGVLLSRAVMATGTNAKSKTRRAAPRSTIAVQGARVHNLKNISVEIPRDKLVVITGLSGSGKSSLAFDTIYAEGQRRYMESLSTFAKRFVNQVTKPDVDFVFGLSPVISIEQKTIGSNPRSTVGTMTDIASYLNLLYATIGESH